MLEFCSFTRRARLLVEIFDFFYRRHFDEIMLRNQQAITVDRVGRGLLGRYLSITRRC